VTPSSEREPPFSRISIAGLGLIGGSVALASRLAWPSVHLTGFDRDEATRERAARGVVHAVAATVEECAEADLFLVAVPVTEMGPLFAALGRAGTQPVVTDVGSTKRDVMTAARASGLTRFVGGHPMGGSERGGIDQARADLFLRRPWLLVPDDAAAADRAKVERFVSGLGALARWVDADTHDRAMAYVSHLPQLVAVALMNAAAAGIGEAGLGTAGRAFTEMTRLAMSPSHLWTDILASNADYVSEAIEALSRDFPSLGELTDSKWVKAAFDRAAAARVKNLGDTVQS
jgi:prephenate dehydrogenase